MLQELLHADDLVLMIETMEGLWHKFKEWMVFERNGLRANHGKSKVMVTGLS